MVKNIFWILINAALITGIQILFPQFWWIFLPVSLTFGFLLSIKQVELRAFFIGFVAGLFSWIGGTVFYSVILNGHILDKTSAMFFVPSWLFVLLVGLIGGLLNGLAFFTGFSIFKKDDHLEL